MNPTWPIPLSLSRESGTPLHAQLADQIAAATREGRLSPGSGLPSVRHAATALHVSPGTIAAAYRALVSQGWIESRAGSGYRVRERVSAVVVTDSPDLSDELYTLEDIEWMGARKTDTASGILNLASATPDADPLTGQDVREAFQQVLANALEDALGYQESLGYAPLRDWLAKELARDGVAMDPEHIQIISGAQQGLDIVAKALLQPGDTVLVEYPTYPGAVAVFRSRGAKVVGVPVDGEGMDPDLLMEAMRRHRPKLLYVIPSYQNPTGAVYSKDRLHALIRIADAFGCLIVEDDYLRELRYDGQVPPPLKQLDEAGRVILVKSYSKLLMPGLRIAYMAVPKERAARLALAKHTTDIFTSGLIQQGFYQFCAEGGWQRHLARMRDRLGERCRLLGTLLRTYLGSQLDVKEPAGGLSYWLEMPVWADPDVLYRAVGQRGVRIVPDTLYLDDGIRGTLPGGIPSQRHIRLSFGSADSDNLEFGVAVLAESMAQLRKSGWKRMGWK